MSSELNRMLPTPVWRAIISLVTIVMSASTSPVRHADHDLGQRRRQHDAHQPRPRAHAHGGGGPQHLLLHRARALIAVIDHRQADAEEDHQRLRRVADAEPQHDDRHQRGLRHRIDDHQQRIEEGGDVVGCAPSSGRPAPRSASPSAKPIAMRRIDAAMLSSASGSPRIAGTWASAARRAAARRCEQPRRNFPVGEQRRAGESGGRPGIDAMRSIRPSLSDRLCPPPVRPSAARCRPRNPGSGDRAGAGAVARPRQLDRYDLLHAAGRARDHHDPVGQEHRLLHAVGDEQHGLAVALPDREQFVLQAACAYGRRARRMARPSAGCSADRRGCARSRPAASCRRRVPWDRSSRSRRDAPWRGARARALAPRAFATPCCLSPYMTLPSTVFQGNSANSWNTGPRSGPGPVTGRPPTRHRPRRGRHEAADDVEQGRFSTAGWAEDGDELAFGHMQGDVADREMRAAALGVEGLRYRLDGDLGGACHRCPVAAGSDQHGYCSGATIVGCLNDWASSFFASMPVSA